MFFDLNLLDGKNEQARREMVAVAMRSGYDGVALNHMVVGRCMTSDDVCKIQAVHLKAALAAVAGVAGAARSLQSIRADHPGLSFQQLTRITVAIEDAPQASALSSANPVLATYDIVAVQPTNTRTFTQACTSLEVDLIVLDLSARRSFRFRQADVQAALNRGLHFEISCRGLFQDGQTSRQLLINAQALIKMTRGKNIILSSGASKATDLRSPYDVANLGTLFGLNFGNAKAAVSSRAASIILRGEARRRAFRGAVAVEPLPDVPGGTTAAANPGWAGGKSFADDSRERVSIGGSAMELDQAPGGLEGSEALAGKGALVVPAELGTAQQESSLLDRGPAGDSVIPEGSQPSILRSAAAVGGVEGSGAVSGRPLDAPPGQAPEAGRLSAASKHSSTAMDVESSPDEWTEVQGRGKAGSGASKKRRKHRNKFMKIQI